MRWRCLHVRQEHGSVLFFAFSWLWRCSGLKLKWCGWKFVLKLWCFKHFCFQPMVPKCLAAPCRKLFKTDAWRLAWLRQCGETLMLYVDSMCLFTSIVPFKTGRLARAYWNQVARWMANWTALLQAKPFASCILVCMGSSAKLREFAHLQDMERQHKCYSGRTTSALWGLLIHRCKMV